MADKILLVDDDPMIHFMVGKAFEKTEFELLYAESGRSVLSLIEQEAPSLLIIDIFMDEQDGVETIMVIKRSNANIPIIAISSDEQFLQVVREFGIFGVLPKPLNLVQLIGLAREAIAQPRH